jgi:predicted Zn-dependent protease
VRAHDLRTLTFSQSQGEMPAEDDMTATDLSIDLLYPACVSKAYADAAKIAVRRAIASLGLSDGFRIGVTGFFADTSKILADARDACARVGKPGQVRADVLSYWLEDRRQNPTAVSREVALLIVNDDLGCVEGEFLFGSARKGVGGTVSTYRFLRDRRVIDPCDLFGMVIMHELGHALGAADPERGSGIQHWFGSHCTNPCVMRQRNDLPEFEADVLPTARGENPFCAMCVKDVRTYVAGRFAK